MPIKRISGFASSDGAIHATIEAARKAELLLLLESNHGGMTEGEPLNWTQEEIANYILKEQDAFLDILTTGPRSRPAARKRAGTTAPKAAAKRSTKFEVEAP